MVISRFENGIERRSLITYDDWDWSLKLLERDDEFDWLASCTSISIIWNDKKLSQSLKSDCVSIEVSKEII